MIIEAIRGAFLEPSSFGMVKFTWHTWYVNGNPEENIRG